MYSEPVATLTLLKIGRSPQNPLLELLPHPYTARRPSAPRPRPPPEGPSPNRKDR
ncbi:MAG: hypothetical protein F6K45_26555, partial [Kamptonema sp. SIO1D9]|nr:hypothetical protein [Kamptonema sp. SIO1D9]